MLWAAESFRAGSGLTWEFFFFLNSRKNREGLNFKSCLATSPTSFMIIFLSALYFLCIASETSESCENQEMSVSPLSSSAHIAVESDTDKVILENACLRSALKNAEERITVLEVIDFFNLFMITFIGVNSNFEANVS